MHAVLRPGQLRPEDLAVELVYGQPDGNALAEARALPMHPEAAAPGGDGQVNYHIDFNSPDSGHFAYGVRVRPQHPDLPNPFAVYLACWA